MAWSFGDSFDLYAAAADAYAGGSYWDAASTSTWPLVAGRFTGSRAVTLGAATGILTKTSGVNDAVHHLVCSYMQTAALSGSSVSGYLELFDGATAQCSIVFRSDGAILLTSGSPAGATLATYTGAVAANNTWYAFEFEVVINNTTGSFAVRKNGNTVNDFSASSLNTRPTSTNNYANKLTVGASASNGGTLDDLFWQSGAATGNWLGDIRCYARMPSSDQSVVFSRTSTGVLTQTPVAGGTTKTGFGLAAYTQFIAAYSGVVTSVGVSVIGVGNAVNMKCAIYADNGSGAQPGVILASAVAPVNPVVSGTNTFTFTGVSVVKGQIYWVGACADATTGYTVTSTGTSVAQGASSTTSYAVFPQATPVVTTPAQAQIMSWTYTATPANWQAVSEAQQDGLTSYVYDSNPGDADFYGISSIASTPATVIATTTRGYMQKSDAGTRTAAVQLKSGASTVASPTLVLSSSGWQWAWRIDLTDPATGAAWTPAAVNNVQVGPVTIA